ncbi:AI-2E family transporter [uncultured Ruminococcus sp.]|uniref:AI-2E family transporter n=1 Tax=uncultured Ruminococcus sp. TaxID=165186 RepID=UPI0025CEDB49|nr:AI-2E family transporter [uncultured Ruminococcus sp.]
MAADEKEKETQAAKQQEEDEKKLRKWDLINKQWAATIIFSGVVILLVAFLFIKREIFTGMLSYVLGVLRPITIGLIIAFLLYRPTCQIERLLDKIRKKFPRFPSGVMAVFCSYFLMLLLLSMIIWIIVPQFITSIGDFGSNIMVYYSNVMKFLNSSRGEQILQFLKDNDINPALLRSKLMDLTTYIPDAVGTLSTWASGLIGGVIDFFIGLIFSIYVLAGRKKLRSQGRQIFRHFLPRKYYNWLSHYGRLTFSTFSNFISGQLTDAFILGVLIFFVMTIGGLEYPMMIAVIIGITNMIPYVGPWMGTIPCALILLMVNPWHAVAFVIIVIIAQQVDSNLIYPRVVGSSIGLPAIWVLFAITVGGGLFGVGGMIIGVPLMSIIYTVIREKTKPDSETPKPPAPKKKYWHIRKSMEKLRNRMQKDTHSQN